MSKYTDIQKEETFKSLVFQDYFGKAKFGYEPNIGNIDFIITDTKARDDLFTPIGSSMHYLWAESKKGVQDVESMLTQLILTCKKTYDKGDYHAPPFLGCFDTEKIAFVPFHDILPIFKENDINWNTTPSNHDSADFQKARSKLIKLFLSNLVVYHFDTDEKEIKEFIKTHFSGGISTTKSPITKDNFVQIFIKWVKEVEPSINISKEEWIEFKLNGILDCDFFRADMMSENGNAITITEKLKIILEKDNYKLQEKIKGRLFQTNINFADGGKAYNQFWNRYERPPADEYQQYIIDRRDLLVPQNIREVKGSFFTPAIWVKKSQEYLEAVFGRNWQDEYYVWDCAAGTGNLLAGLTNPYNVWASTLDQSDVDTMNALIDIDEGINLLPSHVFQFDFLNDSFDKLPEELKKIIDDPEGRKKLIVYINPPYAEAGNKATIVSHGGNKEKVSHSKMFDRYIDTAGTAVLELFTQFFLRIYHEIPDAKLASFSKLKYITSQNFKKFRDYFTAKFKKGFVCQANTFDNVTGKFPIGFLIWDLEKNNHITEVSCDILLNDTERTKSWKEGKKTFFIPLKGRLSVDWLRNYFDKENKANERIAYLRLHQNDIQNKDAVFITSKPSERDFVKHEAVNVTNKNLIEMAIYSAIRSCIEATWLNDRDQFLFPNDEYKNDTEFKNNCLIYTLFNNVVSSQHGINHWIPFTEIQVKAPEKFASHFMSDFLNKLSKIEPFSTEAQEVLTAGLEFWKYYYAKTKGNKTVSVNASFYDIKEYFQGRSEKGIMNTKSDDNIYNDLLSVLKEKLKVLALKIQPKVYQYGFLKE